MKKIILVAAISLATFYAKAQINKGSVMVGIGLSSAKADPTPISNANGTSSSFDQKVFATTGSIGLAIKENMVVGLNFNHSYANLLQSDGFSVQKRNIVVTGGSIFLRKYLRTIKDLYLFAEGNVGYSNAKDSAWSSGNDGAKATQNKVSFSVFPGVCYMLNGKFIFELAITDLVGINYTNQKTTYAYSSTAQTVNSFNLTTSVTGTNSLMFGFKFLFGNKARSSKEKS